MRRRSLVINQVLLRRSDVQAMPSCRHIIDEVGGDHMVKRRLRVIVLDPGQRVLIVARRRRRRVN